MAGNGWGFAIGLRSVGLSKGQTAAKPLLGDRYFLCGGLRIIN